MEKMTEKCFPIGNNRIQFPKLSEMSRMNQHWKLITAVGITYK